jgi:hypothetical protein
MSGTCLRPLNGHRCLGNHHTQLLGTRRCCPQRCTSRVRTSAIMTGSFFDISLSSLTNITLGLLLQTRLFPSISLPINHPYSTCHSTVYITHQVTPTPKHHSIKTYGGVKVQLHALLTLASDGGERPPFYVQAAASPPLRMGRTPCRESNPGHIISPILQSRRTVMWRETELAKTSALSRRCSWPLSK